MTQETVMRCGRIFGPVAIHFLVMNMIQMMGLHADAAFLSTVAAVLVLPLFIRMFRQDHRMERKLSAGSAVLVAAAALFCNLVFTPVLNHISSLLHFSNEVQESLFTSNLLIQLLGVGIIIPIMEEVLFRGLVYQRLKDYNKGWSSVIMASVIFAVYHGNAIQALFAFPMSLVIILSYDRYQTLRAPILFHITVNVSSVIVAALGMG